VLTVPGGASSVMELTVMLSGKLTAVEWVSWTAFQLEFVMKVFWPAAGRTPSDHVRSSQLPLAELVQLLGCASAWIPPRQSPIAVAMPGIDWRI
jgi:hypothetical protein